MKLCYILPQYDHDSAENFFHISNFLEEFGKKVELYVVIEHCNSKPNISNLKKVYVLNDGIKNISIFARIVKLTSIYFELYNKGVDIFYARSSLTGLIPILIANRLLNFNRANVIFWSCGQDVVPLAFMINFRNIKRLFSKLLSLIAFKSVNYLATGPEKMVDYYHQNYKIPKNKILNLYNDISLDRFSPLTSNEKALKKAELLNTNKKVMLFVHTFNKSRGVDILPLIAQKIKKNKLDILVLAIGRPGNYSLALDNIVAIEELQGNLINLGKVANKDIPKYYQIADLFLMPSRGEGFPRVMLEAMACACPTLAFDVGGVSNILPENFLDILLINKMDDEIFIDQSLKIINDDSLLNQLSKESYEKVAEFSTQKVVKMYLDSLSHINRK